MTKRPQGYKQTEVGVIPTLGELFELNPSKPVIKGDEEVTFLGMEDISEEGQIRNQNRLFFHKIKKGLTYFRKNDVLVAKITPCFENGKGACLEKLETEHGFGSTEFHVLRAKENATARYIFYHTQTQKFRKKLETEMIGTAGQKRVPSKAIINYPLTVKHSPAEQTAIATVLNDTDTLITQLEKFIAKKRAVKLGAMQELLRPKDGWEVKTLGKVATLKARIGWQGLTVAEYRKSGDYYLITGTEFKNGFIDWENCFYVEDARYKQDKNIQIKKHDVLVTKDGTIGKVALIKSVPKPATLNSGIFVIRPINDAYNPEFFYYLLLSEVFLKFLSQLSAGSTINHLYQKDFVSFKFQIPKIIDEQKHIVQILSNMDTEIKALENKLNKYQMIKQGMMQNLLTGKIRLR